MPQQGNIQQLSEPRTELVNPLWFSLSYTSYEADLAKARRFLFASERAIHLKRRVVSVMPFRSMVLESSNKTIVLFKRKILKLQLRSWQRHARNQPLQNCLLTWSTSMFSSIHWQNTSLPWSGPWPYPGLQEVTRDQAHKITQVRTKVNL